MAKEITRRQFIQISGLAGTAVAVSGCTINLQRHETIEPYVVPPEEALPGENVWYASTCRMCAAGCGIIARVSNGRARKLEGNPRHPLNRGKLCARGQAGLQLLYNPDRLKNAVRQEGRNSRKFTPIQWEDALVQVAERVKAARPGAVALYSSQISDSLAAVAVPFLAAVGSPAPVFYDTLGAYGGRGTLTRVAGQLFGTTPSLPVFNLVGSDVVFSFGAALGETWLSPVAYGKAYGEMRGRPLGKRGYLVQLEPRLSATGAVADEWVPVTPGSEGQVALAIGKVMVDEGLGLAKASPFAPLFAGVDVTTAAAVAGITPARLVDLARKFGRFEHPVAIPGGGASGHTNGVETTLAILALNALAGNLTGDLSALFMTPDAPDPALSGAVTSSFADVQALIARMQAGEVDVLFIHGNPRYELPVASGFAEGLARVPFVISFSSDVDETGIQSDLILPDHNYLEAWGYQFVTPAADRPVVSGQQPVVSPMYDTRATTDVLLDLANRLGGAAKAVLPWPNTVDFMKAAMAKLVRQNAGFDTKNADTVWAGWRQFGGWWPEIAQVVTPKVPGAVSTLAVPLAEFDGLVDDYPYHLYPYPSIALSDGRGASSPWLQETPDPMTTGSWDTWVEINPETARELDIAQDDLVKLVSPHGEISAIAYIYRGIRPDTVAVPLGQGHSALGRFAADKGANAASLLGTKTTQDGELAWAATRVKIEKLGRQRRLPRIENNIGVDTANEEGWFPG